MAGVGAAMIRAPKAFNSSRKCTKVHQNVLCFYKGDISKIKENYKELDLNNDFTQEAINEH